jgi:hypothetical protein
MRIRVRAHVGEPGAHVVEGAPGGDVVDEEAACVSVSVGIIMDLVKEVKVERREEKREGRSAAPRPGKRQNPKEDRGRDDHGARRPTSKPPSSAGRHNRSLVVLRVLVHAVQFPLVRHSCRFADINDTYSPSVFPPENTRYDTLAMKSRDSLTILITFK